MADKESFDGLLAIRCDKAEKELFIKNCGEFLGKPHAEVIREFMKAFNENRVTLKITEKQKKIQTNPYYN